MGIALRPSVGATTTRTHSLVFVRCGAPQAPSDSIPSGPVYCVTRLLWEDIYCGPKIEEVMITPGNSHDRSGPISPP